MVGPGGEQVGIVRTDDARKLAYEADLDLVEVAPKAKPPVAKIMDYGKFKYEQAQKARESRKNQQQTVVKEQKFRPKIDDHDYETKKGNVIRFLEKGSKVKVTIMFRGREQSRPELGFRLLQRLADDVGTRRAPKASDLDSRFSFFCVCCSGRQEQNGKCHKRLFHGGSFLSSRAAAERGTGRPRRARQRKLRSKVLFS